MQVDVAGVGEDESVLVALSVVLSWVLLGGVCGGRLCVSVGGGWGG